MLRGGGDPEALSILYRRAPQYDYSYTVSQHIVLIVNAPGSGVGSRLWRGLRVVGLEWVQGFGFSALNLEALLGGLGVLGRRLRGAGCTSEFRARGFGICGFGLAWYVCQGDLSCVGFSVLGWGGGGHGIWGVRQALR